MNLYEIEDAITSHEFERSYTISYGARKGEKVTYTQEMDWHELWGSSLPDEGVEVPGVGTVEIEATHGGEGQGDTAWVVLRVTDENGHVRFFRKDGFYASYEGADFDGNFYEVAPREKTVTVYE